MFDIGFPELVLIAVVALLVIGPERLPEALRTLGLWLGRMRRSFAAVKTEIEKEIGMDDVRRQLHNEAIMEEMKRIEGDVRGTADSAAGEAQTETAGNPSSKETSATADNGGR
jgi:sec-independent protein translocase protein TatB